MPRSSAARTVAQTQSSASVEATRIARRPGELRVALRAKVERIRSAMVNAAPYGFQARVADLMEARKERISRELAAVEKLSVECLLAEIELHRAEGRDEAADSLLKAFTEGQPIHISTDRAIVVRMKDGQLFLDLQP